MLTIFSTPRPFHGIFATIQRNAIRSWLALHPEVEVILFNDEENSTLQVAEEFGVRCVTNVAVNEFGTPVLDDVFANVRRLAHHEVVGQVNTDILLLKDFTDAIGSVRHALGTRPFLMVGRRWNLDVTAPIEFGAAWQRDVLERVHRQGKLHTRGLDYWVFPLSLTVQPPPFAVGRWGIDSWFVYRARTFRIPVIDATDVVTAIHQNHDYPRMKAPFFEAEIARNVTLAGGQSRLASILAADWILTEEGLRKPRFLRRIVSGLALLLPWRVLLVVKRRLQKLSLGLAR